MQKMKKKKMKDVFECRVEVGVWGGARAKGKGERLAKCGNSENNSGEALEQIGIERKKLLIR